MSKAEETPKATNVQIVPFALIWPVLKFLAVPLLKGLLPEILEKIADAIRNNRQFDFSDEELAAAVEGQQETLKAAYRA